jgi:large conductance mechanosensitive channel
MLKEFKAFVLRGNVVDLAVGVVIGAAFGSIVNALVGGMLNPLIAVFGDTGLRDLSFTIGTATVDGVAKPNLFRYGMVLDAIINFLLVAAAVFFLVVKPVNHLSARLKAEQPLDEKTRECPECLSSIPTAASRCAFCTAKIAHG